MSVLGHNTIIVRVPLDGNLWICRKKSPAVYGDQKGHNKIYISTSPFKANGQLIYDLAKYGRSYLFVLDGSKLFNSYFTFTTLDILLGNLSLYHSEKLKTALVVVYIPLPVTISSAGCFHLSMKYCFLQNFHVRCCKHISKYYWSKKTRCYSAGKGNLLKQTLFEKINSCWHKDFEISVLPMRTLVNNFKTIVNI